MHASDKASYANDTSVYSCETDLFQFISNKLFHWLESDSLGANLNKEHILLTLIWMGFLEVRFVVGGLGGGGSKLLPRLKLVRVILET